MMIEPADTFGASTLMFAAFFAIQSFATRTLSSAPALSWQTVIDIPPSPSLLRASV
jgi:hypothetical protein